MVLIGFTFCFEACFLQGLTMKSDKKRGASVTLPVLLVVVYERGAHVAKCNRRGDVVMQCHHH